MPVQNQRARTSAAGPVLLIDAASFATVRVISGAATLSLIVLPRWRARGRSFDRLAVGRHAIRLHGLLCLRLVIWYAALRHLTATRAATVQLSVPVIAAFGGVIVLAEELTVRLVLASVATLGGVAIVLAQRVAHAATIGARG